MRSGLSTSIRRHVPARALALAGVLIAGALVAATPLEAAASTSYGVNLVQNSGAESGLKHWETFPDPGFLTVKYGASGLGYPSKSASKHIGGGKHFFTAGQYDNTFNTCPDAQQQIDLSGIGSAIDSGHVKVSLSGYAGTNGAADINAHLDLYFRDIQNHPVANNGFTKNASSTNEQYKHITASKVLPKHTRILRVHLWADGGSTVTGGCQAFWDNISVVLKHV